MMPDLVAVRIKDAPPIIRPHEMIRVCALSGCDVTFVGFGHSFIVTYATRGDDKRLAAYQCPPAEAIKMGNLECQHFACCPEHALIVHILCMRDHVMPTHYAEVDRLAIMDQQRAALPTPKRKRAKRLRGT